jgi:hypothetical protein
LNSIGVLEKKRKYWSSSVFGADVQLLSEQQCILSNTVMLCQSAKDLGFGCFFSFECNAYRGVRLFSYMGM